MGPGAIAGSGDPAPPASRKLDDDEVERLSIDLGSYGGFLFSWPARMKRAGVSRAARKRLTTTDIGTA
jgi:hypothetical protein